MRMSLGLAMNRRRSGTSVSVPVLTGVTITDSGAGNGVITVTYESNMPSGAAVEVAVYIDVPADADPVDGAAVAAGTGASGTATFTSTIGATNVPITITGSLVGTFDVFVASRFVGGDTWSNVVPDLGVAFDTTPATNGFEGAAYDTAFASTKTFSSADTALGSDGATGTNLPAVFTAGKKGVWVYDGNSVTISTVTIDGVSATKRYQPTSTQRSFWEADITGNTTNTIVVGLGGSSDRVSVAMYDLTGLTFQSGAQSTAAAVTFTTSAGDVVIAMHSNDISGPPIVTNMTKDIFEIGGNARFLSTYSNFNTTGGSPESFSVADSGSTLQNLQAVHYA